MKLYKPEEVDPARWRWPPTSAASGEAPWIHGHRTPRDKHEPFFRRRRGRAFLEHSFEAQGDSRIREVRLWRAEGVSKGDRGLVGRIFDNDYVEDLLIKYKTRLEYYFRNVRFIMLYNSFAIAHRQIRSEKFSSPDVKARLCARLRARSSCCHTPHQCTKSPLRTDRYRTGPLLRNAW